MPEDEQPSNEDRDFVAPRTGEAPKLEVEPGGLSLEALPEKLGFVEDETTKQLRQELIAQMAPGSEDLAGQQRAYDAWRAAAEKLDKTPESHIGLVLSQTLIFKEANLYQIYVTELKTIFDDYGGRADNQTMREVIQPLETEILAEIESWPSKLDFHETAEMRQVRQQLTAEVLTATPEEVTSLLMLYTDLANQIILAQQESENQ